MAEESFIDKIVKKFDDESVIKFSEKNMFTDQKVWVHSSSPELDFNLGTLGFPVGITEIAGKSRSGKTTLALMGMKFFQKSYSNGISIILSSENRDNKLYAQTIGVDVNKVIIIKSKFVEDLFFKLQLHLDYIYELWKKEGNEGTPKIYIMWDSVGGTLARAEKESFRENIKLLQKSLEKGTKMDIKHPTMAAFAKQAKMMIKNMLAEISENDIIMVALNHTGDKIGGHGRKSYGGEWVEYLPCLRLETILTGHESLDEVEVAQYTKVKVVKNDFGSRKATVIEILLGYGVILSDEDLAFALSEKIIVREKISEKVKTLQFSFMNGKLTWKDNGKRSFYQLYETKNKFLPILHKKIKEARHRLVIESKTVK